jgi:hypothetical protein
MDVPPRADAPDTDLYHEAIEARRQALTRIADGSKPYREALSPILAQGAALAIAIFFLSDMLETGWTDRKAIGAFLAALLWWRLIQFAGAAAVMLLQEYELQAACLLRIPYLRKPNGRTVSVTLDVVSTGVAIICCAAVGMIGHAAIDAARQKKGPAEATAKVEPAATDAGKSQ